MCRWTFSSNKILHTKLIPKIKSNFDRPMHDSGQNYENFRGHFSDVKFKSIIKA